MKIKMRVVVLISGRGSNLKALLEKQDSYHVVGVVCDNQQAEGLKFAAAKGVPAVVINRSSYESKQDFFAAVQNAVKSFSPNLIALAGFMRVLPESFVAAFFGKLFNIHPSLLPQFPGLHTHERAIEAKLKEHGCTVHLVDQGVDTGAVIAQSKVAVLASDTAETLSRKVLEQEHKLYPWVVEMFARNDIQITDGRLVVSKAAELEAEKFNFILNKR
jgi:phosphoribosylglycinamide formyltransferase-1